MAWHSLGHVTTTAGTPVRITANTTGAAVRLCHAILVEQWPGNTGKVYVMRSNGVAATGVGVLAILPIPTTNSLPSVSAGIPSCPDGLNAADYYIDVEVSGEGPLVSILIN